MSSKIFRRPPAHGQKGRGSGGRNFCPPVLPREAGLGVEKLGGSIGKILWILLKESSDIVQQAPPMITSAPGGHKPPGAFLWRAHRWAYAGKPGRGKTKA